MGGIVRILALIYGVGGNLCKIKNNDGYKL